MLKQFFQKNWQFFFGEPLPGEVDLIPLTSCREVYGNDLVLIFTNARKHPSYVLKICRTPRFNFKLYREYAALKSLSKILDLHAAIPTPIYCADQNGRLFFIQKGIPGTSLFKLIKIHGVNSQTSSLIEQSIQVLAKINCSAAQMHPDQTLPNSNTLALLKKYKENFTKLGLSKLHFDGLFKSSKSLQKHAKQIFSHGDYWPSNIMINEQGNKIAGIIDWEFSSFHSAPIDICWFLINLAYCLYQRDHPQSSIADSFKWAFFETGSHNTFFANLFDTYSKNCPQIKGHFLDILKLTLSELSVRELSTYGKHTNMDIECFNMLIYLITNENNIRHEYI